jgi:hypothetical protein
MKINTVAFVQRVMRHLFFTGLAKMLFGAGARPEFADALDIPSSSIYARCLPSERKHRADRSRLSAVSLRRSGGRDGAFPRWLCGYRRRSRRCAECLNRDDRAIGSRRSPPVRTDRLPGIQDPFKAIRQRRRKPQDRSVSEHGAIDIAGRPVQPPVEATCDRH